MEKTINDWVANHPESDFNKLYTTKLYTTSLQEYYKDTTPLYFEDSKEDEAFEKMQELMQEGYTVELSKEVPEHLPIPKYMFVLRYWKEQEYPGTKGHEITIMTGSAGMEAFNDVMRQECNRQLYSNGSISTTNYLTPIRQPNGVTGN